jgi:diacylglycerol kinase family enzyme
MALPSVVPDDRDVRDERPLYIVLNPGSGAEDAGSTTRIISEALGASGRRFEILAVGHPAEIPRLAARAVDLARRNGGIVVAAGGDGTLNAVVQVCLESGCEFGAIPRGTFNYFGRAHGIPVDTEQAVQCLLSSRAHPVPVGLVNDRVFLVNASLGLYPESLELREEQTKRLGRYRHVAAWAALLTVLRDYGPMRIRIGSDEAVREVSTLTLFVGINPLQLERLGLDYDAAARGQVAAILLRPVSRWRLLGILARGTLGSLADARGVETLASTTLRVTPKAPRVRRLKVAIDGEVEYLAAPIEFRIAPRPLLLLKPESGTWNAPA